MNNSQKTTAEEKKDNQNDVSTPSQSADKFSKTLRKPCGVKCPQQCTKIINENQRQQILRYFHKLGDLNLQRLFVQKCVEPDLTNRRDSSLFRYFFTINGRRIRVCQLFFLSTLAIQSNFITDALNIIFEEKSATETEDKRLQPKIIEGVINHIKSIPRIISCSVNSKGEREYFETSIKLDTMFNLYVKYSKDNKYPLASFEIYKEIFNSKNEIFKKCQDSVPLLEANEVTLITLKADSKT